MSGEWQPARGERVLAVLPDGHEAKGVIVAGCGEPLYCVALTVDQVETVFTRTVKPLPVTEPTAFGARVIDAKGKKWVRVEDSASTRWVSRDDFWWRSWDELAQPVTILDADPDWTVR